MIVLDTTRNEKMRDVLALPDLKFRGIFHELIQGIPVNQAKSDNNIRERRME